MKRRQLFSLLPGLPVIAISRPTEPLESVENLRERETDSDSKLAAARLKTLQADVKFWRSAVQKDAALGIDTSFSTVNLARAEEDLLKAQLD